MCIQKLLIPVIIKNLLAFFLILSFVLLNPWRNLAQIEITNNPASEGRIITPAGKFLIDSANNLPAVMSLTMDFVRSPDGRYLIAVNSGYGLQMTSKSRPQQTLSVIDLQFNPEPAVIQNVYFPAPQSANFGLVFNPKPVDDKFYQMYVAGGFENKIWLFQFNPNSKQPISPGNEPDSNVNAPFIDVSPFTENLPTPTYNNNRAAVYPTGIALSPDGTSLFVANNLSDNLGLVSDLRDQRRVSRIGLRRENSEQFVYPYDVEVLPATNGKEAQKVYISLWGDATIAVYSPRAIKKVSHISVERHPTAMILNKAKTRLYVVNSNADSVSVIDTKTDRVVEKINVQLAENTEIGASPEGLALSEDEKTLYVANSHANAVAVISISQPNPKSEIRNPKSKLLGFIPTGQYPSAVAAAGNRLFIANGKGTGFENSSIIVNNSGRASNMPNKGFPGESNTRIGAYNPSLIAGNITFLDVPNEQRLLAFTQQTMRNNGLLGRRDKPLFFNGQSPFKHVIYIIRENRSYDQVFGDLPTAGDGTKADGDPSVAIFGAGEMAKSPQGKVQNITPNARKLALRFGLLDRFFVNAEASPDGHNWSTAAFSNDYVDKAFRWDYSGRGRTYDYEGFNRLPSYEPPGNLPPVFNLPATEFDVANYMKKYVPYLRGARDVGEPETLYLWDAAKRAGLTYRNYGEYIGTISADDLKEINTRKGKGYPDISPTLTAFPTKKSLEGNFSQTFRNYDLSTPDSMTVESYRSFIENKTTDPIIRRDNPDSRFRGNSRFGEWLHEFRGFVADLQNGKGDRLPNLTVMKFPNDHTTGLRQNFPTPQFYVAENDYALGRLVEEVSNSPYWKDTAIFVVEDDAQNGPDHVDAHRSPAFVISAYNRQGVLIHDFHNTVSLIRTLEICLGLKPMNLLDATATPIDFFNPVADFTPYRAEMPSVDLDNLTPPVKPNAAMQRYFELTNQQNLTHADMANPQQLNEIIWFSVRGDSQKLPEVSRLPAFDLMTAGILLEDDDEEKEEQIEADEMRQTAVRSIMDKE
jgi:YVTN family beta-propeller protein